MSSRKNLAVAVLFAAMLVVAVFAGSRTVPTTSVASTVSAKSVPSAVVAVDSVNPTATADAWKRTPAAALPGEVLVIPTSGDPACPERLASSGNRTSEVLVEAVACSADPAARDAARLATLQKAADQARASQASLVLIGEDWTKGLPLQVTDPGNQQQVGAAILQAAADGTLPNLRGLSVSVIAPVPAATDKAVWDAYFTAAGARRVEWLGN